MAATDGELFYCFGFYSVSVSFDEHQAYCVWALNEGSKLYCACSSNKTKQHTTVYCLIYKQTTESFLIQNSASYYKFATENFSIYCDTYFLWLSTAAAANIMHFIHLSNNTT